MEVNDVDLPRTKRQKLVRSDQGWDVAFIPHATTTTKLVSLVTKDTLLMILCLCLMLVLTYAQTSLPSRKRIRII